MEKITHLNICVSGIEARIQLSLSYPNEQMTDTAVMSYCWCDAVASLVERPWEANAQKLQHWYYVLW